MINVVVADDEYFARKVLVKMLKESDLEIQMVKEAETGVEVMDILKQERIDLVITDIRMPDMDGLKLSERIQKEYPDILVMIESGYADFSYATSAIRFGVREYLTKPVSREELVAAVNRVWSGQKQYQEMLEEKLAFQRIQYMDFSYLLEKPEAGEKVLQSAAEQMAQKSWRLCAAQSKTAVLTRTQIEQVLLELEKPIGEMAVVGYYFGAKSEFILILSGDVENDAFLETVMRQKIESCAQKAAVILSAGISKRLDATSAVSKNLTKAYREAVYTLNQRLLQKEECVFFYEEEWNMVQLFSREHEKALEQYLSEHNAEQSIQMVRDFFRQCQQNKNITIYSLFNSLIQIMNVINRIYGMQNREKGYEPEMGSYLMFSFKTDLYAFQSLEELQEYMIQLITDVTAEEDSPKSSIISDLLKYLERNYQYDISVNELAAHKYFVNPSYLSRLFKAETGKNFSRYLMELRMERARKMLEETSLKISDIATYVGYNDVSYFIQIFKKQHEMTPEQYRDLRSNMK